MRQVSGISVALAVILIAAAIAYLTFEKQPDHVALSPSEPSQGKFETIVGDETPFFPEW